MKFELVTDVSVLDINFLLLERKAHTNLVSYEIMIDSQRCQILAMVAPWRIAVAKFLTTAMANL